MTELEQLKKKLKRKINAYATAKVADSWKYETSNTGRVDEIQHELRLQSKQLDELVDHLFGRLTPPNY